MTHRFHLAEYAAQKGMLVTVMCNLTQYGEDLRRAGFNVVDWRLNRGSRNPFVLIYDLIRTALQIKSFSRYSPCCGNQAYVLVGLTSLLSSAVKSIYCVTGLGFIYTSRSLSARLKYIRVFCLDNIFVSM